jgi:membrane protein
MLEDLQKRLKSLYTKLNQLSGGALRVLRRAAERFGETQATQAAAGLAYYTFFSLFPLLIVLVAVTTYLFDLGSEEAFRQAVRLISEAIPVSQNLIGQNLQMVLERRGTFTLVGVLAALWSASNAFTILSNNINLAWSSSSARGFLGKRLVAFAMVGAVVVLLVLSLLTSPVTTLLSQLTLPFEQLTFLKSLLWTWTTRLLPILFSALMFLLLYRWVPTEDVSWRAALWGTGVTTLAWQIAQIGFTRFIRSGMANYELVYGSLGTVVILLFWVYISAVVILFGAHLTAAIDQRNRYRDW